MATNVDARAIASTLYESLLGTALDQLRAAAPKLAAVGGRGDPTAAINAALPANALPQVRNLLLGLAKERLLEHLPAVIDALAGLAAGPSAQLIDASVTSAVELSAAQQELIVRDLRQRYGQELNMTFTVDPSLIGGLIIRVGDQVLDNSLRTRLSAIQRNMLAS